MANTRTPFPAIVKIPTVFSGLAYKFDQNPIFYYQKKIQTKSLKKKNFNIIIQKYVTWVLAPQMRLTASDWA